MGLLSWIWDGIRGWVEALFKSLIDPIRKWFSNLVAGARKFAENLVSSVEGALENAQKILGQGIRTLQGAYETLITKTLPDLIRRLGDLRVDLSRSITKSSEDLRKWASNTFGPTIKAASDLFRDPAFIELTRDPYQFAEMMAARYMNRYMQDAAKSFTEGLQEGLRESEE